MSLVGEYQRQLAWRDWPRMFGALPPLAGQLVLDLGCAIGDQAAELVGRGARVIGVDANQELLEVARARLGARADFRVQDLRALPSPGVPVDGVWSSFAAAYFVDFAPVLASWVAPLRPGGWIALVEVDDLFGHEPVEAATRERLDAYVADARAAGRYDFRMGGKLEAFLTQAGFRVEVRLDLEDRELAFDGPALPEVVDAWRARFDRMLLLQDFCGAGFAAVREDFLACLGRADHRAHARVVGVVARQS